MLAAGRAGVKDRGAVRGSRFRRLILNDLPLHDTPFGMKKLTWLRGFQIRPTALAALVLIPFGVHSPSVEGKSAEPPPTLRQVFPPGAYEMAPPGAEKFIIFSRGEISSAWEFIPSQPDRGVVKRVEFAPSSWVATLAVRPDLGIERPARDFVLFQVSDSRRPHNLRLDLYRIDFRSWSVEALGESPFSSVAGGTAERLLVAGPDGIVPFSVANGAAEAGAHPFTKLHSCRETGLWLISQGTGPGSGIWSFRPSSFEKVAPLPWPRNLRQGNQFNIGSIARSDGRAWAMVTVDENPSEIQGLQTGIPDNVPRPPFALPENVRGTLWLAEAETPELRTWPVALAARRGSGNPWISEGTRLWFDGEELHFQTVILEEGADPGLRHWTVGDTDGEIREMAVDELRPIAPSADRIAIPEEYAPAEAHVHWNDPGYLAAYFLKAKGFLETVPGSAEWCVALSGDRRRFLWKTQPAYFPITETPGLPPPAILLYGDLDEDLVIEIPCPPELVRDNALNIEWVECLTRSAPSPASPSPPR